MPILGGRSVRNLSIAVMNECPTEEPASILVNGDVAKDTVEGVLPITVGATLLTEEAVILLSGQHGLG